MSRRSRKRHTQSERVASTLSEHQHRTKRRTNRPRIARSAIQENQSWESQAPEIEDDHLWHRLSDQSSTKDVPPTNYIAIHNQCYEAYNSNPLAYAIIELTTSFVLGEGITISARNPRVQQVIDNFWYHPENRMDERIDSLCSELSLYGEQFIHYFVNKYDGSVIIRQIDPSLIDEIETDPEDIEKPLRYHRRPIDPIMTTTAGDPASVIQTALEGTWFKAGEDIFHIAINKVSNARRGRSDLATLLPWLKRYRDWLINRASINRFKATFVWDVTLHKSDKRGIERKKMEYARPPQPGTVLIHNEDETWSAIEPKINADDVSADGRALKLIVAVGALLPEHYLSDGDNGNRATATEMSLPTLLKFKRRQRVMRYMLTGILDRVLVEAQRAGKLGPRIDTAYEITFPEIDSGEHNVLAQGMQWLLPALQTAKSQGWISDETAMRIMFEYCGEEVDVHEEVARIAGQQRKGGESDCKRASP